MLAPLRHARPEMVLRTYRCCNHCNTTRYEPHGIVQRTRIGSRALAVVNTSRCSGGSTSTSLGRTDRACISHPQASWHVVFIGRTLLSLRTILSLRLERVLGMSCVCGTRKRLCSKSIRLAFSRTPVRFPSHLIRLPLLHVLRRSLLVHGDECVSLSASIRHFHQSANQAPDHPPLDLLQ